MAERVHRCAVYTRKSTEDGLEQEFNSLDAQYEACAAYAASQRHEGWALSPARYDDGGFSAATSSGPVSREAGDLIAATLRSGTAVARIPLLESFVSQIVLREGAIDIAVRPARLLEALGQQHGAESNAPVVLTCPAVKARRGHQVRLVIPSFEAQRPTTRDDKLTALVAEAHAAQQLVQASPDQSIARIAAGASRCRARLTQLLALSCLAPDIVTAIIKGRQPPTLTARSLLTAELLLWWHEQRAVLGFS